MKFRTEYQARPAALRLDPRLPVVLLGSCFAENMARCMRACLWKALNPLGTLYNPLSIAGTLAAALAYPPLADIESGTADTSCSEYDRSLFYADGKWRSWLVDSRFASTERDMCRRAFAAAAQRLRDMLASAQALFVTFGTAWCYLLDGERLVANCHKQPAARFTRQRLTAGQITEAWHRTAQELHSRYPQLQIVFTVSPVRHLKDGMEANARSKAVLLLAVEELTQPGVLPMESRYFAAYEIVNDDLRDYRFYAEDLAHPSETAVSYIWDKFKETYLDAAGIELLRQGEKKVRASLHRPLPDAADTLVQLPSPNSQLPT